VLVGVTQKDLNYSSMMVRALFSWQRVTLSKAQPKRMLQLISKGNRVFSWCALRKKTHFFFAAMLIAKHAAQHLNAQPSPHINWKNQVEREKTRAVALRVN
jgi:hypothetical protein